MSNILALTFELTMPWVIFTATIPQSTFLFKTTLTHLQEPMNAFSLLSSIYATSHLLY